MRFAKAFIASCAVVEAFAPYPSSWAVRSKQTLLWVGRDPNLDLSGNTWKPTEGRMHVSGFLTLLFVFVLFFKETSFWIFNVTLTLLYLDLFLYFL